MSFCNLNFDECINKIQEIITNTINKYKKLTAPVNPENVIRDLTELNMYVEAILSSTFSSSIYKVIITK